MPADPIADFFAAQGVNPEALVAAIAAVIVVAAWGWMAWAIWRGIVR